MTTTPVTLIAAVARNGVIGDGLTIPWDLPGDLARFKRLTMGHPVVMGRRTFDSIGRPLPGRRTLVITRQHGWHHADVETAHSVADALTLAGSSAEVFVAGGGQIYVEAMPLATRLVITEVRLTPTGDVHFPVIDPAVWQECARQDLADRSYVDYVRRGSDVAAGHAS